MRNTFLIFVMVAALGQTKEQKYVWLKAASSIQTFCPARQDVTGTKHSPEEIMLIVSEMEKIGIRGVECGSSEDAKLVFSRKAVIGTQATFLLWSFKLTSSKVSTQGFNEQIPVMILSDQAETLFGIAKKVKNVVHDAKKEVAKRQ